MQFSEHQKEIIRELTEQREDLDERSDIGVFQSLISHPFRPECDILTRQTWDLLLERYA